MGDGGRDEDQDSEEQYGEGHDKFGSSSGRDHTALSYHQAFFEFNQAYVLCAWHMLKKHGLLRSSFQMLNRKQSSGDGAGGVPSCIFDVDNGSQGSTDGNGGNLSSTASSNKSTSKNKAADTVKGLNNLGDSLKELSKSSERVARIAAESSNVQSLHTNIESLESQRMQLVLAKLNHMDNAAAAHVLDAEIAKIEITLSERQHELNGVTSTPDVSQFSVRYG